MRVEEEWPPRRQKRENIIKKIKKISTLNIQTNEVMNVNDGLYLYNKLVANLCYAQESSYL